MIFLRTLKHGPNAGLQRRQVFIDDRRHGWGKMHLEEIAERMQTERLSNLVHWDGWTDEKYVVAAFELAIEQRHVELPWGLSGSKPPHMPEADWQRMRDITGVSQFDSTR